ncbi:MAG: biopolymer transporter ExbD [Gammaproteobacteria bacterium]|nr:biopolymer transporter ExbD [Gammaproteobacteria bacterium]
MQFEGYRRSSHVPNLTPLIDIVFLLLIFFMLTSHFVREEAINIELPKAETGEKLENNNTLEVVVRDDGVYLYENTEMDAVTLETVLRQQLSQRRDKVIRIKGDRAARLGNAVELIDLSRKAGAQGVDIVTEKNEQQ